MQLSIVTGTYNRREYLAQMVKSARSCMPRGMDYEFVIVDGGSTDGTIDWCLQQADIELIEQGELLGAIKAFDAGAYAARGEYVILGNDDIVFHPNSIVPAIVALESDTRAGAVAFLDDRPAPGYGSEFKIQTMTVLDTNGVSVNAPYAQVGMFRRWLGDACGWWGSRDTAFNGHTYGGDNYLSSRIYEHGYSVAVVETCKVSDLIPPDGLRERNHEIEQQNGSAYYRRYPTPPIFAAQPTIANPQEEKLRTLYLPIFEPHEGAQQLHKKGLREALSRQGLVYEIDYVNTRYDLVEAVKAFKPHLLLIQAHAPNAIPVDKLKAAREVHPNMIVVNWNGDVYEKQLISPEMLAYLHHFDLSLVVNENVVPIQERAGIPSAYWQVGYEPVDYDALPDVPAHEVVFLANCYSDSRKALGRLLQSMPGINVGLYGRGWNYGNGDCTYNFPVSSALYSTARISIGDNQYPDHRGFVSNRIFEALASGAFLLHQTVPGLEDLTGLVDGTHYVSWSDEMDLQQKIKHYLTQRYEKGRARIAEAGRDYVRSAHNFDKRVEELFRLIQRKVGKRESGA
jgi:hypothetical protein